MARTEGMTRRAFLKWMGLGAGSVVVGGPAVVRLRLALDEVAKPRFVSEAGEILPVTDLDFPDEVGYEAAQELLHAHLRSGKLNDQVVRYIVPGARYPHYWYWDSMLAAIAASFLSPELARELLEAQALIFRELGPHGPQIVYFNRSSLPLEYRLFRKTRAVDGVDQLTQTPLSGFALEMYAVKTGDRQTVQRLLPDYAAHYAWLMENRIIDPSVGLPVTIHPFESLDAQPAVDLMYRKPLNRNSQFHTLSARTLVHNRSNRFEAARIAGDGGYVKYDVCFLAFYVRSLFALAKLWAACDDNEKATYWQTQATAARDNLIRTCFDPDSGFFYSRRANADGELLKVKVASGLFPLLLKLPAGIVAPLIENLVDPAQFLTEDLHVPFVARNEVDHYQEELIPLWRGPGNSVIDFVIVSGLYVNQEEELAGMLYEAQYRRFLQRLQAGHPFPEFYTPEVAFRAPNTWGALALCDPQELFYPDEEIELA